MKDSSVNIKTILEEMISSNASDLHLKVNSPPVLRIDGKMEPIAMPPLHPEDLKHISTQMMSPKQQQYFQENKEIDFAIGVAGLGRFRTNIYQQRGTIALVLRAIPMNISSVDELMLPPVLKQLALRPRGLILVTGVAGSGKSTTLAAMIQHINENKKVNIITIEDPIEFLYRDELGLINQREVNIDTRSFSSALKHVLRQDPDVILVGEIRDLETLEIALRAANTGHLVLSTLHTIDAAQTINRVISFFPPHHHQEVRFTFANTLQAIISLRLIPRTNEKGRVPAVEILVNTASVRDHIIDPQQTAVIPKLIQEGVTQYGMQTFDQSLMKLYRQNLISYDDAIDNSSNPGEFALRIKGIESSSDKSWEDFEGTANSLSE